MKFEIKEKVQEDEGTVKFFLQLGDYGDGICLMAEEENGVIWYIIKITHDGQLLRCRSVPDNLGLDLDEQERIIEAEE